MEAILPDYNFTCRSCGERWVQQRVILVEASSIRSLKIVTRQGKYEIDPYTLMETCYESMKEHDYKFVCSYCNLELTQEDIQQLAFDNLL